MVRNYLTNELVLQTPFKFFIGIVFRDNGVLKKRYNKMRILKWSWLINLFWLKKKHALGISVNTYINLRRRWEQLNRVDN